MKNILIKNNVILFVTLPVFLFLAGCAEQHTVPMMPAPVIYHDTAVDPYSHLHPDERTTSVPVLYATNRVQRLTSTKIPYGNGMSDLLHLGEAQVHFGDDLTSWQDLYLASTESDYPNPITISLGETEQISTIDTVDLLSGNISLTPSLKEFTDNVNDKLSRARDKEILIYVHGAKGNFLKSVALTAEIDHFTGRDFVGIAYSWPSHQNILSYVIGVDGWRAKHSTASLRTLLKILAKFTSAKHINIICYSAGGKLVSKALGEMRENHSMLSSRELKSTFKLGTVLFTAADVSVDRFLTKLPQISQMAQQVVVTVSDADNVLQSASLVMGGNDRIGTSEAVKSEEEFVLNHKIINFEIIDFSLGKEARGFDITGHHYWHRHPWAASDIIFLLRSDLPAKDRGLTYSGMKLIWYLAEDYPRQVRDAAKQGLKGQW